jgi:hypothetical protein
MYKHSDRKELIPEKNFIKSFSKKIKKYFDEKIIKIKKVISRLQ